MSLFSAFTDFLNGPVGNGLANDPADVRTAKTHMEQLGVFEDREKNGFITRELDGAIRNFQRSKGLRVDGQMMPGGETERTVFQTLEKRDPEQFFAPSSSREVDATGRRIRSDEKLYSSDFYNNTRVLPLPTSEYIDKEKLQKILDYDPNKGGGDFFSFLKHGFEPRKISGQAEEEAQKIFPRQKGFEDESDAFRHALGSYMITKRYGSKAAKQILDRHERAPRLKLSPTDTEMGMLQDLYNNRVGQDAALDSKNEGRDPVEVIKELYDAGKLQTQPFRLKPKNRR